ncbi:MAG: hypothetical protein GY861_03845 [bacterium]|nr:hypothetical protein [bacterium]
MNREQAEILEKKHNVVIDEKGLQWNINDAQYGWEPIPDEWLKELEENMDQCNCEQALYYKKVISDLAKTCKNALEDLLALGAKDSQLSGIIPELEKAIKKAEEIEK